MEDPVNPFETMLHELMMPLYRVLRLVTLPLLQQPGPDVPLLLSGPGRKAKQPVSDSIILAKELPKAPQLAHQMVGHSVASVRNVGDVESLPTQDSEWGGELTQQIAAVLALTETLPTLAIRNHEEQLENYSKGATNRTIQEGAFWLPPISDLAKVGTAHDSVNLQQHLLSRERDLQPQMAQTKWPEMIKHVERDIFPRVAENVETSSLRLPEVPSLSMPLQIPEMSGDALFPELNSSTNDQQAVRQMIEFTDRVMPLRQTNDTDTQTQQEPIQETNPLAFTTPTSLTVHVHNREAGAPNVRQQIEEVLLEIFDTMNTQ